MPHLPHPFTDSTPDLITSREVAIGRKAMPSRVRRTTETGVAIENGRALVQAARVRGVEQVAYEALRATGRLSQLEGFWTTHASQAAGRLTHIADLAAIGMADIVAETGRE